MQSSVDGWLGMRIRDWTCTQTSGTTCDGRTLTPTAGCPSAGQPAARSPWECWNTSTQPRLEQMPGASLGFFLFQLKTGHRKPAAPSTSHRVHFEVQGPRPPQGDYTPSPTPLLRAATGPSSLCSRSTLLMSMAGLVPLAGRGLQGPMKVWLALCQGHRSPGEAKRQEAKEEGVPGTLPSVDTVLPGRS